MITRSPASTICGSSLWATQSSRLRAATRDVNARGDYGNALASTYRDQGRCKEAEELQAQVSRGNSCSAVGLNVAHSKMVGSRRYQSTAVLQPPQITGCGERGDDRCAPGNRSVTESNVLLLYPSAIRPCLQALPSSSLPLRPAYTEISRAPSK
jgi:hypothetical protein